MKKVLLLALVMSLVLGIATVLRAGVNNPGVKDTPHDIRVITGEESHEPCAICHTPHSGTGEYPLWNRDQGAQTYTLYDSPSFDMVTIVQPQSPSSLCLVCHNGVFSSLVNYPGPGSHATEAYDYEMNPTFWAMLGTDLRDEHPISFPYNPSLDKDRNAFPNATLVDGRNIIAPTAIENTNPGAGYIGFPLYGGTAALPGNQFECATCHSVHDTVNYTGKQLVGGKSTGTQVFFLRANNTGSLMCAECHVNRYEGTTW